MTKEIILASQSPRRVAILTQMGVTCLVMPADIDETALLNEAPTDYALRLAQQKAMAIVVKQHAEHLPILAADTTVAIGKTIFGKPENAADAYQMLKQLSGSTHQVHTAIALAFNGNIETAINTSQVTMMALSDAMIHNYIASNEPMDKAGSYAIQGIAGCWISHIAGSYTGVMGLPMFETAMVLQNIGFKLD